MDRAKISDPASWHRLIALGIGASLGCAPDLPLVEHIGDLRPLAVRVEVQDSSVPADGPTRAEALPFETVRVVPLWVDAAGPWSAQRIAEELQPIWLACDLEPGQPLLDCVSAAAPLTTDQIPNCPTPDPTAFATAPTVPPNPCIVATNEPGAPLFTVPVDPRFLLGGDIELTMVGHRPGQGSSQACLSALLAEDDSPDSSCLIVVQRLSVGPDGELVRLAETLGIPAKNLPLAPDPIPDPDTHPRISSILVDVFDDGATGSSTGAQAPFKTVSPSQGELVEVPAGARLELAIQAPPEDLQTYAIVGDQGTFATRDETYSGRWFVSWGELLGTTSNDPTARNTWTLRQGSDDESDLPDPGELGPEAFIMYVLRDDRQGVTWRWFRVHVTNTP